MTIYKILKRSTLRRVVFGFKKTKKYFIKQEALLQRKREVFLKKILLKIRFIKTKVKKILRGYKKQYNQRQKKKFYKQKALLILLIKNKIKSIKSEYKSQKRKLRKAYKKELKYLSQEIYLGISFFNKQKNTIFSEFAIKKEVLEKYLFLFNFNLFKKLFKKQNKKIKNININYFLIKFKSLFIEIINDEKQVFKNLFNSIGDELLRFMDSFENYQIEIEKLFIKSVFKKMPRNIILAKNKAKKEVSKYIREYKKLSKK